MYKYHMDVEVEAKGDDEQVLFHRQCALRLYFMYLVDTSLFMDKSETYVEVVYLTYFIDL